MFITYLSLLMLNRRARADLSEFWSVSSAFVRLSQLFQARKNNLCKPLNNFLFTETCLTILLLYIITLVVLFGSYRKS